MVTILVFDVLIGIGPLAVVMYFAIIAIKNFIVMNVPLKNVQ